VLCTYRHDGEPGTAGPWAIARLQSNTPPQWELGALRTLRLDLKLHEDERGKPLGEDVGVLGRRRDM
jgi:hypothetical protein